MCGGLPAPECSDNPLGYKFSWSSRGVLLALKNEAKFYENGKIVNVSSEELMGTAKPYYTGFQGYSFVGYPNRDSTPYLERYQMPECETCVRGTLRYAGFPQFVKVLVDMGLLSDASRTDLDTNSSTPLKWSALTASLLGSSSDSESELLAALDKKTSIPAEEKSRIIEGLRWIGLFSSEQVTKRGTPLDSLCATLEAKMEFGPGERDLVFLQHRFHIEWKDGKKETRTSTLVENGDPNGYSAMAKLVGVPCGVAVLGVLSGTISQTGILAPMDPKINDPLMKELKDKYGIFLSEKTV